MVNSQDIHPTDENKIRFRILNALYTMSKGYKQGFIPLGKLYEELKSKNDRKQKLILENLEYLRSAGLVDSKALGTVSITHKGIKEFETAILRPSELRTNFPSHISKTLSSESRNSGKRKIQTIQKKRRAFVAKAYELSKGSSKKIINAFDIANELGYDQETLERIYFYLQDEGLIKPFAIGGKFTITHKGMELAREQKEESND